MAAIGQPARAARSRRPFGVRLYLTLGFAAVASIAAGFSYLLVTGSGDEAASVQASNITLGRTARLADRIGAHPPARRRGPDRLGRATRATRPGPSTRAADLLTPRLSRSVGAQPGAGPRAAIAAALRGSRTVDQLPGVVTVASVPLFRDGPRLGRRARPGRAARGDRTHHRRASRRSPDRGAQSRSRSPS